ncbi:MAG TPA: phenylalanine--tRNA ligase subunit beta [Thermoanaerobaculia bacterium]|jgi:phenylalanyl-tRNA synthetase beta chain|nr:phenylalanine--tRNA ligase subunit beta [Thermoanaerobaculia bacterium]
MKFSLAWLRELAPVPAEVEVDEIARRLTAAGFHVEGVEEVEGDVVLDVDVTTNRVDAMCHLGLARELGAIFGVALREPVAGLTTGAGAGTADLPRIDIAARTLCRRYVGLVVRGVTIAPSPEWLQRRLLAIGSRPINNVVDVTNYVLWERGQPLHAFDLATLPDQHVIVREAREGESVRTLDGEVRKLVAGMLVIADPQRPIALAGVMGGQDTEVGDSTRDVLIESAWFDPKAVRRTAKALGMHTDASHRFERGVDPEGQLAAARRAAGLLAELAGGTVVEPAVEAVGEVLPPIPEIVLSHRRLERFAGGDIPTAEAERLLAGVGFAPHAVGTDEWRVGVPPWRRFDVLEEADLFEEVLRLHGFDRIAPSLPAIAGLDAPELPGHKLRRTARAWLAAAGFVDAIAWAFYGDAEDARFATFGESLDAGAGEAGPALALLNPLSERHGRMRRSLLPGLLESASFNRRRGAPAVRLFEVGHVFWRDAPSSSRLGSPRETEHLALVVGGREGNPWQRAVELDLFDAKGAVEGLAAALGRELEARPAEVRGLVPGRAARLHLAGGDGAAFGILGQLDEPEAGFPLFVAEIATAPFTPLPAPVRIAPPSRHPAVAVDLTFTHALDVPWSAIAAAVESARPAELVAYELENRYQGQGVPPGAVNTTIHFVYNAADRSLTQEEVNARQAAISALLDERFGWKKAG